MKRAILDITTDLLSCERTGAMFDAISVFGLTICCSLKADYGKISLLVEERPGKSVLPAECADSLRHICPVLTQDQHGHQRIIRVSDVIVGPAFDVAA